MRGSDVRMIFICDWIVYIYRWGDV